MKLLIFALTVLAISACGYVGSPMKLQGALNDNDSQKIAASPLNYATVNSLVIQPKCLNCHHDHEFLHDVNGVRSNTQDIIDAVFIEKSMPPKRRGPLTACEAEMLKAFLEDGAPTESTRLVGELTACQAAE